MFDRSNVTLPNFIILTFLYWEWIENESEKIEASYAISSVKEQHITMCFFSCLFFLSLSLLDFNSSLYIASISCFLKRFVQFFTEAVWYKILGTNTLLSNQNLFDYTAVSFWCQFWFGGSCNFSAKIKKNNW